MPEKRLKVVYIPKENGKTDLNPFRFRLEELSMTPWLGGSLEISGCLQKKTLALVHIQQLSTQEVQFIVNSSSYTG